MMLTGPVIPLFATGVHTIISCTSRVHVACMNAFLVAFRSLLQTKQMTLVNPHQ